MPGAEAPYPAPEGSDKPCDWSLRPFTFHQEIPAPSYDSIFCHFGITNLTCFGLVCLIRIFFPKLSWENILKTQTTKGVIVMMFPLSQATHGSGRGALEARPCTQKKRCWEPKFKKKSWANSTVSTKNPNTNPEISCSNKSDKLVFQQNKRQITRGFFVQHGGNVQRFYAMTLWQDNAPFWSMSSWTPTEAEDLSGFFPQETSNT